MDDKQEAILMFRSGVDVPTIAKELDVSAPTIYRWISKSGSVQNAVQERNALVVAAYQQNWPIHRICIKFDVSQGTVYNILHSAEIPLRRKQHPQNEKDDETIISMYRTGCKISAIRTRTGRSLTYIYSALDRLDIPLRRSSLRPIGEDGIIEISPITTSEPAS